jgi:hypothetical protein
LAGGIPSHKWLGYYQGDVVLDPFCISARPFTPRKSSTANGSA